MVIGAATIELEITDGATLKDKRQVVKSLLDRIRGRFNVSAAEVDRLDSPRQATFAIAVVANDAAFVHRVLEKAVDLIEREPRAYVSDYSIEIL
jgi:uncharacterized protein YlxP (DUF503 family)